ncbi:hypothetical protein MTR67_022791 [Solanum verrucosum]|uniref:RNase H type-1 domain-containing protein n=1 Tax=Solanum verrucosum TaxID=315347 RepID=A0AAF0TR27_SOLVR|nr:hypothetical protein MTR67_022791 [Solanum verrucosum]
MIQRSWKVPWSLIQKIEEINEIMSTLNIQLVHIFREANQLADYITNIAINHEDIQPYYSFQELPSKARKILNMDKQQIPSIRIRTRKINISNNNDI